MATWSSSRSGAYRDASPISPLSPLSPNALPRWLRTKKTRPAVLSNSKVRFGCAALACLVLGSTFTWTMGPSKDINEYNVEAHDLGSGGVLNDPSGCGLDPNVPPARADAEHDEAGDMAVDADGRLMRSKQPSVAGALSDLHHAVSSKLQTWNPYYNDGASPSIAPKFNVTSLGSGKKTPPGLTPDIMVGEEVKNGIDEEERLGARTRVGKCTILFNSNSIWERAIRTHEQHDKIHGYRLHVLRQSLVDDVWSKPAYVLSLLLRELAKPESERLEWLLWVDADTIILNPYIPIEMFLPPPGPEFEDIHLIYSNDWNGLNNGVFPVRVNQWSVQLFSAITSFRHFRPEEPLVFRDQSAMNALMQEPAFAKHLVQAPQRWFNAYQGEHNETLAPFQIRRGDLLVHFAGVPDRGERMTYWLDRAEQHLDDWEIPVKSTSYPQEARDFWLEQKEARKNMASHLTELRVKATELLTKTEERMNDYGERLSDEERKVIIDQREQLQQRLGDPAWQEDTFKLEQATQALTDASAPLMKAIASANKILLSSAHEAIFAGEKDLLEGGFDAGVSNPELQSISEAVKHLKNLVMSPEEFWNRADISNATNEVNEARAKLHETTALLLEKVKELEDAKKAVQADADRAAAALHASNAQPVEAAPAVSAALGDPVDPENAAVLQKGVTSVTTVPIQIVTEQVVTFTQEAVMVYETATVVQEA